VPARRTAALAISSVVVGLALTQGFPSLALAEDAVTTAPVEAPAVAGPVAPELVGPVAPEFVGPVAPAQDTAPAPDATDAAAPAEQAAPAQNTAPTEISAATAPAAVSRPIQRRWLGRIGSFSRPTTTTAARTTTTAAAVAAPSALPVGNRPGWRQVLAEDFNGTTLPSGWGKYYGEPGSEKDGWWEPSHVTVGNGAMHLNGYKDGGRWVTGGVMNSHAAQTRYGKYEVRFRMTKGVGVKYAILLWPHSDNWPVDGEIDFAEDGGGNRSHTSATMHYGTTDRIIQREIFGQDFSQWHTVGVEWTPGKIVYTLDGKPWGTVVSDNVPSGAMDLAIQTETGTCGERWLGCPDATTPSHVNLDVDWVAVWQKV
jgi:hypothetical protein